MCCRCRTSLFETIGGAAACRGEWLADDVATRTAIRAPWPDTDKARALELGAVIDLSPDAIMRERFAREAGRWARKRWEEIRNGSPVRQRAPMRRKGANS